MSSRLARGALCALLLSLSMPATAAAAFGDPTLGIAEIVPEHTAVFPIDGPHDLSAGRTTASAASAATTARTCSPTAASASSPRRRVA